MLVDGDWRPDATPSRSDDGEFEREETTFRDRVGTDRFPAEAGRYHLYIARSCPWAHGAALVRRLCGLTDAVSMDVVDPVRLDDGWEFSPEKDGCTPDSRTGADFLREVYTAADPDFTGRVTVPVLWDRHRETIVNNESIEIMRMFASEMTHLGDASIDLYPPDRRAEVDRIVEAIYDPINNGVYRAGFATTQDAYDLAVADLFDALDHWDAVLADQRYLLGDRLTLADLRLFATLVRFDPVYHTHFKCNRRRIRDYDALWPYLRDLHQTPGFAETVVMDHIRTGYYAEHRDLNPHGIVPAGPMPAFEGEHDRDRLPGGPPGTLETE